MFPVREFCVWFRPSVLSTKYLATGTPWHSESVDKFNSQPSIDIFNMFRHLEIIIKTINLSGVKHIYQILDAKASPVAKYSADSTDGRNHIYRMLLAAKKEQGPQDSPPNIAYFY